ncbi:MAG: hypothetical protein LBT00_03590 [Spirochaetaceae bacterium]|nr:hypothetical protein [Spirochaetaceae bacterium]
MSANNTHWKRNHEPQGIENPQPLARNHTNDTSDEPVIASIAKQSRGMPSSGSLCC